LIARKRDTGHYVGQAEKRYKWYSNKIVEREEKENIPNISEIKCK
jgi:hypothetical protein